MKVETSRFGIIEVEDSSIITMPKGPLGFENYHEFCLIQHRPDTSFKWLQSAEEPSLAFVVIDPSEFFADYEIEISDTDVAKLELTEPDDAMVLSIVTVANDGRDVTANLAAPVVVNSRTLVGIQVVLADDRFTVKHPIVNKAQQVVEEKTAVKAA